MTIYLDANATVPLSLKAKEAMVAAFDFYGNTESTHQIGRRVRALVDEARKKIHHLLDAPDGRLVFTSGGTEANNLALKGFNAPCVLVSAIEHASVLNVNIPKKEIIPVKPEGVLDLDALDALLKNSPKGALISVMLVNNETGVVQPLPEIVKIARSYGAFIHTDAIQAVGKIPLSFQRLDVDMMTVSAHKFGGPIGVGALVMKESVHLNSQNEGGGHEYGLRSGTVPFTLISGFLAALEESLDSLCHEDIIEDLRDQLEKKILQSGGYVIGTDAPRVPGTSCIVMPGVESALQLMHFDLAGIAVGAGSACSSGKVKKSHVLSAMKLSAESVGCAIRVSLSDYNKPSDVDAFVSEWTRQYALKNHDKRILG